MIEKILERLEEERKTAYCTHERFEQKVDLGRVFGLEKAIDIVQEVAKEYEPCYKDCAECEAYDKVKHNCPKFCKVIKETVKEYGKDTNVRSNADRIRSMSDEELAEFLTDHHNYPCKYCVHCWKDSENDVGCKGALMRWLKSEVKE